jgi:hypothetical protein
MERKVFNEMVSKEINHLRTHATAEEKSKLDFISFDYQDHEHCIYGQMTGDCFSDRAKELMPKTYTSASIGFFNKGENFTALEKYLFMVNSKKHLEIINYIKGDSQILLID